MRMTITQYLEHEARFLRNLGQPVPDDAAPLESPLQDQIEAECNRRGWVAVRTRMNKATTFTTPGVADFIIALPDRKTLWLECKSRTGKQTPEQRGFQMRVERLGHEYALVRSFAQFLELINRP